jgi:hypothetical protein
MMKTQTKSVAKFFAQSTALNEEDRPEKCAIVPGGQTNNKCAVHSFQIGITVFLEKIKPHFFLLVRIWRF